MPSSGIPDSGMMDLCMSGEGVTDLPPGVVVGDFEIVRRLGAGGMGTVYEGRHVAIGRRAAIKVIGDEMSRDADSVARFRREARAVAQLASPHIVDVFGFGELPDGRSYYLMELLSGESLRDRLDRGRVPLDEALDLLAQICRGLEVTHDAGIVHRDLKPENIFITRSASGALVKLLDFGLVKLAEQDDVAQTQAGIGAGTPLYASPEQLRSARDVDSRADIYSLGCVAYEVLLGRVPFQFDSIAELIAAHLSTEPDAPRAVWPGIPAALDALLLAMLAKDPSRRPPIGHVQEAIERVRRSGIDTRTRIMSTVAVAEAPQSARPWRVLAVDAGACALVVAMLVLAARGNASASAVPQDASVDAVTVTPIEAAAPSAPDAGIVSIPIVDAGRPVDAAVAIRQATTPVDAGVAVADAATAPTPPPDAPLRKAPPAPKSEPLKPAVGDRNQTFNPFAKKHTP